MTNEQMMAWLNAVGFTVNAAFAAAVAAVPAVPAQDDPVLDTEV